MAPSARNLACWAGSIHPRFSSRSARRGSTAQRWPAVKAWRKKGKFREGLHRDDARLSLELVAQRVEVELGFEVVHARLEDRLAVQADPEPDGARGGQRRQGLVREVIVGLCGREVDVGEDDDAGRGMLQDLSAPTRPRKPAW